MTFFFHIFIHCFIFLTKTVDVKTSLKKSSFLLKLYIFITLPINYLINKIKLQSIINLDNFANKNQNLFEKDLKFLFEFFNSDKGEKFINQYLKPIKLKNNLIDGHLYHNFYEQYLRERKQERLKILELGSFKGNATAAFFFYFQNSIISSGDLYPDLFRYRSKRIKNFFINNSLDTELNSKIIDKQLKFDLIVEDAGHYFKDQIISLFMLFGTLNSKGIFVIEELDFPDTRKDMNEKNESPTLKEILISIKQNQDFESTYVSKHQKEYFLNNFSSIEIFKGKFNEIAFIKKK